MSEFLTTGQMIDRLRVGGTAELSEKHQIPKEHGKSYKKVTKAADGDIVWMSDTGLVDLGRPLVLFGHTVNWKWRILPNYVSFEEAMKSLKDGGSATLHNGNIQYKFVAVECIAETLEHYKDVGADFLEWRDLFRGKWTIENE